MKYSIFSNLLIIVSLYLTFFSFVVSWGPLTHQTVGCLATTPSDFGKCFPSGSFITASSAPDAFKMIDMNFHSLGFAGFMIKFAHKIQPKKQKLIDFALGYGAHLVMDQVGHHANGYLTNGGHSQEVQVDTYMFAEFVKKRMNPPPSVFPFVLMEKEELSFVTAAQKEYFTLLNKTALIQTFETLQKKLDDFQNQEIAESGLVPFNEHFYKDIAKGYDFCKPATWEESKKHLDLTLDWSVQISKYYVEQVVPEILKDNLPLTKIEGFTMNYADRLYNAHNGTMCDMKVFRRRL